MRRQAWLLLFAAVAIGLEAGTVSSGYLVRRAEGLVFVKDAPGSVAPLEVGFGENFPADVPSFARKGSKIELIGPGKTLRFGENTNFTLQADGALRLYEGSVLIYSRRPETQIRVEGPMSAAMVSGEGAVMLEVTTNGGFKVVGLLGAMRLAEVNWTTDGEPGGLSPGELIFMKPLGNGFGDKLNVRLSRICATSRLINGYGNPTRLRNDLQAAVEGQNRRIGRSFGKVVGDAPTMDRFQTFPLAQP